MKDRYIVLILLLLVLAIPLAVILEVKISGESIDESNEKSQSS